GARRLRRRRRARERRRSRAARAARVGTDRALARDARGERARARDRDTRGDPGYGPPLAEETGRRAARRGPRRQATWSVLAQRLASLTWPGSCPQPSARREPLARRGARGTHPISTRARRRAKRY